MPTFEDIMNLDVKDFFRYIETIRYGYREKSGKLHFTADEDFSVHDYAFSSPEEVVKNNCGWCWDIAELTKVYCARHEIPFSSWFMEYHSDDLHQTHTQVFVYFQGKWCPAPENSLGLHLGEHGYDELEPCVEWFADFFRGYLRSVLGDKYDESHLLLKEYTCTFSPGITDEEYLLQIRQ